MAPIKRGFVRKRKLVCVCPILWNNCDGEDMGMGGTGDNRFMKKRTGKRRKMQCAAGMCLAVSLGLSGCGRMEKELPEAEHAGADSWEDEITIMHADADNPNFTAYIDEVQERLQMKINILPYPVNADSRHAKVSFLLAAGDPSVDIFAVNDEMINAYKNEGYLEPLQNDVMDAESAQFFPQEYLKETTMAGDQIYSAPYMLDVLALWVNEEWIKEAGLSGIESEEDFYRFLSHDWGEGRYAYGGSWEKTYVYNELGEFINLFGGDYYDWENEKTRKAVRFFKECIDCGYTPKEQMIDQYEQMNQKFIDGKYGMVCMYSGGIKTYTSAGMYGVDKIHLAPLPNLGGNNVTYIGTWQYALNKASQNKEAAKRFISYAISKEGNRLYAEMVNVIPARSDLLEEDLDITGYQELREFLKSVAVQARPIPANSMEYLETVGELFQEYMLGEIDLESYCGKMQELVDQ